MIVVDASAITNMLVFDDDRGRKARRVLASDPEWVAPPHWRLEVFAALRGLNLGRKLTDDHAERAHTTCGRLGIDDVPLTGLWPTMWQLRQAMTGYDAAYVAVAQTLGLALVTADARLARTAVGHCAVNLVA